jgi:hypothetical protein
MLVYLYKRIPSEITEGVPDDWRAGHSPTGWMTLEVFNKYIGNIFAVHLGKYNVQFPDIFFID